MNKSHRSGKKVQKRSAQDIADSTFKPDTLRTLDKLLNQAVISDMLREAISETIKALESNDYPLAYQITACKSLIVGGLDCMPERNAFREDAEKNKKIFKQDVYCILDGIHHEIAFAIHRIPSGCSILCAPEERNGPIGVVEMKHEGVHPIVQRIKYEHEVIEKEVRQRKRLSVCPA